MKKYLPGIISVAIVAAAAIWWFNREPTLAELQQQFLLAKTKADSAKVVERLEKYYLQLSIPDTIRQRVESAVAAQVDTTKITLTETPSDTNVYRLEGQLQNVLRLAAIARARNESQTFQNLIRQAGSMAQTVDAGTQNNYWTPFVDVIGAFNKEKALYWLKAKASESLCNLYLKDSTIADAEKYAALGLDLLQRVKDERAYLDIIRRLQWILYSHHSKYQLSIALAQKALPQADNIKYHLRANSFMFVQAMALSKMGQNRTALILYDKVFRNAEKFWQIKDMVRFTNRSLIEKGEAYRELGEFEQSWNVYREAAKLPLNQTEAIDLQVLKFNLLLATSHYEQAKDELNKAILLAEREGDQYKRMICLNNFGALYARLTDYDLALAYYKQAQSLFTPDFPNISERLLVLENIADILAAKNDSLQYEKIIEEALELLKSTHNPRREAQLLSTIGGWYQNRFKKHNTAMKYYHIADSLFYQNGILRFALIAKIDLVDCLVALSRFREAEILISEIELLAERINDVERLIDAHDRKAQIHYREGRLVQAVSSSSATLQEIEKMSSRFNNQALLIAYRQKIYDLLKYAVLYDIALHRPEAAFAKLDSAKAYALKNRLSGNHADHHRHEANGKNPDWAPFKSRLQAGQLLLDYMIMPDTLYVFLMDRDGLQLLRKNIDIEVLQKTVNAYKDSINKTFHIVQAANSAGINAHFANTVALGQKLYQELLGWPEIESRLQHTALLYVIPDEFLYELPFSTLLANSSEARTFLANRSAILTLPGASFLRSENHASVVPDNLKTMKVLVSADKRFPSADKFVAQIKTLFPLAEELTVQDGTFTKDEVLAQLQKDYPIYIFVGHGQANSQYPDQGYIELSVKASGTPTAKIVRLTMANLKTISWSRAEMVMLVGCETAGGKLYRGTGISGLQQEFFALGVKNVLGNFWEVNAPHAIALARNFLTIWAATGNPSRALRESELMAMHELSGHRYYQQPHPYFWGSAVLLTAKPQ